MDWPFFLDKETAHRMGRPLLQNWIKTPYDLVSFSNSHHNNMGPFKKVHDVELFFVDRVPRTSNQFLFS